MSKKVKNHLFIQGSSILLISFLFLSTIFTGCASSTKVVGKENTEMKTLLKTIVINMGDDTTITDATYSEYFKEDTAEEGVKAIINAGEFFINEYAIPATEDDFMKDFPDGYMVNQSAWLYKNVDSWNGGNTGEKDYSSYEEAAFNTATAIPAGLEEKLYDTDGDGFADLIEAQYLEGVIVNKIIDNGDGTYSIERGDLDPSISYSANDGQSFDGPRFTSTSGEKIKAQNFDTSIKEGDVALFWYGQDGWILERAIEINGMFVDGADHEYYQMGDVQYQDAMRFSRNNIIISNRNGEYTNVQKYFGFINNDEGLKVSLWLVPTTNYPEKTGAPVSITSNENAKIFLDRAISFANEKLNSVTVSVDGSDIPNGEKWTTQSAYDELSEAISRAKEVLGSNSYSSLLDYQAYLLYLTLNGSDNDIGAKFGGFNYKGFNNQISDGKL